MPGPDLRNALIDLPRTGTLIKDRPYRQVWRFEHAGKAYYLKFYPRAGSFLKRRIRGNPALREFRRLQWLQKATLPAPRGIAVLLGFKLADHIGDAVVLEAIEPSITLATHIDRQRLAGEALPNHRALARQVNLLLSQLNIAGLGHADLHLGNLLLHNDRLYLLDAYAIHRRGLRNRDLMLLAHSAKRIATLTDLVRAWHVVRPGQRLPPNNPLRQRLARKFVAKATTRDGQYFGRHTAGDWGGYFTRRAPSPRRWSKMSQLELTDSQWAVAWAELFDRIHRDRLQVLKRSRSGDVLAGQMTLAEQTIDVIVKRPRRKFWWRYINEIGRGSRARRAWSKAWALAIRDIPTAWPIAMMQQRTFGYVVDGITVFERIPGPTLAEIDLDALAPAQRETLFRRAGRLLREMEHDGLYHWDAKAWNFIVRSDDPHGLQPMLIDVDSIRRFQYTRIAIHRLLRSMRDNPTYTIADSRNLCLGYAPAAMLHREA